MATILPFRGTRFDTTRAGKLDDLITLPYDRIGQVLQDDVLSRLLTFPNVIITAHQAFLTTEGLSEIARITVANVLNLETGHPFLPGTQL